MKEPTKIDMRCPFCGNHETGLDDGEHTLRFIPRELVCTNCEAVLDYQIDGFTVKYHGGHKKR